MTESIRICGVLQTQTRSTVCSGPFFNDGIPVLPMKSLTNRMGNGMTPHKSLCSPNPREHKDSWGAPDPDALNGTLRPLIERWHPALADEIGGFGLSGGLAA